MTAPNTDGHFAPLDGIRIIDFSSNIAGPWATMILAQLGADVIKVESPHGDDARAWAMQADGQGLVHRQVNVGKRSVVIDLKAPEGVEIAGRLCETAHVLLQSMRPGVAERIGIGRDAIKKRYPKLLYYDLSGFGAGPTGQDMPGYDPLVQAFSGIVAMNGYDNMAPVRCAPSLIDFGTGQWIAMGIMASILSETRGQHVSHMETALVDTAFSVVPYQAIEAKLIRKRPPKAGSGNPVAAPYQCFEAKDGDLLIAAPSQRLWEKLVGAIDARHLLDDPRFESVRSRTENLPALELALNAALRRQPVAYWVTHLAEAGIPAAQVAGLEQSVDSAIAEERETFQASGAIPLVRLPWLIDGQPVPWNQPAPHLGEHTRDVLREIGYPESEIDALVANGGAAAAASASRT